MPNARASASSTPAPRAAAGPEAVAATPGTDFGANRTRDFVRFAYTRAMADLEEAAARLARFCG